MIAGDFALRLGAAAAMLCATLSAACAQTKPPVEAFAALPAEPPQISPDGSRFALIRGVNGRPTVLIYKIDAPQESPQSIGSDNSIVAGLRWVKNDILVIADRQNIKTGLFRDTIRPTAVAVAVRLSDHQIIRLLAFSHLDDIDLDNADTIYTTFLNVLLRVDIRNRGNVQLVMKQDPRADHAVTGKWFLDGHGNVVGRLDGKRDDGHASWHAILKLLDNNSWRPLAEFNGSIDQGDGVAGISEDGKAFIRFAPDHTGAMSVDRIDMATGMESKLYQDPVYDASGPLADAWTGRIIGFIVDEDLPVYHYFDPKLEAQQKGLEAAFSGLSVHAISTDLAGRRAIVEAEGPKTPPSYYLYDRTTHHASAVAASYPDLNETEMGQVKPYGYAARDGLHIPAYLTLPPGRDPHKLPLIVMPHGGPDMRDDLSFDFFRQFLANRGYAVLQPQFRGSKGFGRAFTNAGLRQWGLKMQDDISDGVQKAIADGIADPKRVCIFGASYGGYAALAGATLTPELYACVVSLAGPSNLQKMLAYSKSKFGTVAENYWMTRIGDRDSDSAQIDAVSPALHGDRVTAPVLLLHSELDVTVPIEQSEMMADALTKAGKNVQFIRIEGDDHYLSLEQTRVRVLQEIEKFLAASIGA
jgi:dipeptidyl aminopeptidase/acylaminoacyl peptidase